MERRLFLRNSSTLLAWSLLQLTGTGTGLAASLFAPLLRQNRLRPPGAVSEDIFAAKCIRCGRCVEVCPYRSIRMLDIREGIHAGTPVVEVDRIPCYLCMKCVNVCPTGSLLRVSQDQTRMGLAVIDRFACEAWIGITLCRTCYDKCPFPEKAIRLDQLRPIIESQRCTGCGICTHACPVSRKDGSRAINIEPVHAIS